MGDVVDDSIPEPQNAASNEQVPEPPDTELKIGIFCADEDIAIARRIQRKIKLHSRNVRVCEYDCGNPKMEAIESFVQSNHLVLWIATQTALQDEGLMKAAKDIGHYAGTCRYDIPVRFVALNPNENLNARLPLALDAYSTLKEDASFNERLQATVASVAKKLGKTNDKRRPQNSTATTNAIASEDVAPYQQIPPASDETLEHQIQVDDASESQLCAVPENPPREINTVVGTASTSSSTYVIHVHGEGSIVQVGSDNVVTTDRANRN